MIDKKDEQVIVRAHKRRRILKVTRSATQYRIRLADPKRLRNLGFRFRTLDASKAKGLTLAERRAVADAGGTVVVAFRGPKNRPSSVRVQAILLPAGE